jgi:DNA (cytosine-5)-methyltransferase 1
MADGSIPEKGLPDIPPPLVFGSVCDGMSAAHVASRGLDWRCAWLAEIDPQASATTAHHYPNVPSLGDITAPDFADRAVRFGGLDLIVGGTPCQSFSLAGLRNGLADDRGNLTLRFVELTDAVGHAGGPVEVVFWENVPGVLSDATNAFGCFLAALVGEDTPIPAPRAGWTNAGLVAGPARTAAWRVLDAQGFVPQRRRRVFVVAARHGSRVDPERVLFETEADALRSLGDRTCAGPLFPEREGVRGDTAPGRGAGEIVAALTANGVETCGADDNQGQAGHLIPVAFGGNNTIGPIAVSTALNAHGGPHGRLDFESETFIVMAVTGSITHALNTANNGKHCSEDGTGRGVSIVATTLRDRDGAKRVDSDCTDTLIPVAYRVHADGSTAMTGNGNANVADPTDIARCLDTCGGYANGQGGTVVAQPTAYRTSPNCGAWETGDRVDALTTGTDPTSHLVAFSCKDSGADAGGQVAVVYPILEPGARTGVSTTDPRAGIGVGSGDDPMFTLQAGKQHGVAISMAVRRLLPVECLRLQGFPDDYFDGVTYRGKPLADGPMYKMIGNSWNTDTVRWIFRRIDAQWRGEP